MVADTAPPRRGRRPKYSPEELEQRMLAAALDALLAEGVTGGVEAVRIEKVIADAAVPRAAAYSLWEAWGDGAPQENLRRAVILQIISRMPSGNADATATEAATLLAENVDRLESDDAEVRLAFRRELTRHVASFNFELLQDQRWRVYKTLTSSIGTQSDPELRAAVASGEEALVAAYNGLFEQLRSAFGLELRPGLQMHHFTMAAYALNEGLSNRVGESFADQTAQIEGEEWTLLALGFDALVDRFFVDPRA